MLLPDTRQLVRDQLNHPIHGRVKAGTHKLVRYGHATGLSIDASIRVVDGEADFDGPCAAIVAKAVLDSIAKVDYAFRIGTRSNHGAFWKLQLLHPVLQQVAEISYHGR